MAKRNRRPLHLDAEAYGLLYGMMGELQTITKEYVSPSALIKYLHGLVQDIKAKKGGLLPPPIV